MKPIGGQLPLNMTASIVTAPTFGLLHLRIYLLKQLQPVRRSQVLVRTMLALLRDEPFVALHGCCSSELCAHAPTACDKGAQGTP